jgi:integration host factor subunit beta
MTRSDIIKKIYQHKSNLLVRDIERIVDTIVGKVASSLADGHRIELRGFGVFAPKHLAPKVASNPKGGSKISLGERTSVKFKTGKILAGKINGEAS